MKKRLSENESEEDFKVIEAPLKNMAVIKERLPNFLLLFLGWLREKQYYQEGLLLGGQGERGREIPDHRHGFRQSRPPRQQREQSLIGKGRRGENYAITSDAI